MNNIYKLALIICFTTTFSLLKVNADEMPGEGSNPGEGPCHVEYYSRIQPTQGVFQNDIHFQDKLKTEHGVSVLGEKHPKFISQVNLVKDRFTYLVGDKMMSSGIYDFEDYKKIIITGKSTYPDMVDVTLKVQTHLDYQPYGAPYYPAITENSQSTPSQSPIIQQLPLSMLATGKCLDEAQEFYVEFDISNQSDAQEIKFNKTGTYDFIVDVVDVPLENPTGMKIQVWGNVVETRMPKTLLIPAMDYAFYKYKADEIAKNLYDDTKTAKFNIDLYKKDFYPIPSDLSFGGKDFTVEKSVIDLAGITDIQGLRKLHRKLFTAMRLGKYERNLLFIDYQSYQPILGTDSAGMAVSTKLGNIKTKSSASKVERSAYNITSVYDTAIHELNHLLNFSWADSKMQQDCNLNYHNKTNLKTADGVSQTLSQAYGSKISFHENDYDIMSAAEAPNTYANQCTWRNLVHVLAERIVDPPLILVSGTVTKDGLSGELAPAYTYMGNTDTPNSVGDYTIILKDHNGNEMESYKFDPNFDILDAPSIGETVNEALFSYGLPYSPELKIVELHGPKGLLESITLTENEPIIEKFNILSSTPNPDFDAVDIKVSWDASDKDNDELLYTLLSSSDDEFYHGTIIEISDSEATIRVPEGSSSLKLFATDGTRSSDMTIGL